MTSDENLTLSKARIKKRKVLIENNCFYYLMSPKRTTDPMFDDIDCMFVIRSAPHIPAQGNFVREQMNQKTSFLDLSQVQF